MDTRLEFMKKWRKRFDEVCTHGRRDQVVVATGASKTKVTYWGVEYYDKTKKHSNQWLPDVFENDQAAVALGISPAWLAYGVGPVDPKTNEISQLIAARIEVDPGLSHVVQAWIKADVKEIPLAWARSICQPVELKTVLVKPSSASAEMPAQPSSSAPIPDSLKLSDGEAKALKAWLYREVKSMPLENQLPEAIRKIAKLLRPGSALREQPANPDKVQQPQGRRANRAANAENSELQADPAPASVASKASETNAPPYGVKK